MSRRRQSRRAQRQLERAMFGPPPRPQSTPRTRRARLPDDLEERIIQAQTPGNCSFCGNVCSPYLEPWRCDYCGVVYPPVQE